VKLPVSLPTLEVIEMAKKIDEAERNKRLDELSMVGFELDDKCSEIWLTLMAYERLRFNELHKALKKFDVNISKPALLEHLKHLIELKLIERREEGFQNVSYGLTEKIRSLLHVSQEDIKRWFEAHKEATKRLPPHLRPIEFDLGEFYDNMPEKQLIHGIDRDLNRVLSLNLHELKNYIQYDLKLDKKESDADFWKLIGNPMYRMLEKSIAENCRASERYRKKIFEKMDTLINEFKSDKKLSGQK
jgi:DNA-binding HxlR family transcriptional regulator